MNIKEDEREGEDSQFKLIKVVDVKVLKKKHSRPRVYSRKISIKLNTRSGL